MNFIVIGAGAWGTAFAVHLARLDHRVTLVPRRPAHASAMASSRQNADYLPGIAFPPTLAVAPDLDRAAAGGEVILVACPSQSLRETAHRLAGPGLRSASLVLSLAKGLELGTHLRPSEVLSGILPSVPVGALTGPTTASEVARGLPAAMVLATSSPDAPAGAVQAAVSSRTLRVYTSDDLAGVEFGGALKNIYAIAAGCADGLRLGDNAKAGLLTRALAEMVRVGETLGARAETFYGLSGFGDLVATSYGEWSRNRDFGRRIGAGESVASLLLNRKSVVEGYRTTESFAGLCETKRIDAPILLEMHAILFAGKSPAQALATLMGRDLKGETPARG